MPFGKQWVLAFDKMTKIKPTFGREINARIYRDFDSLRAYHNNNFKKMRADILKTTIKK